MTRLKANVNPLIVGKRRKWRARAISVPGRRLQDVLGDLTRELIDVTVEITFKRRPYAGKQSSGINTLLRAMNALLETEGPTEQQITNKLTERWTRGVPVALSCGRCGDTICDRVLPEENTNKEIIYWYYAAMHLLKGDLL